MYTCTTLANTHGDLTSPKGSVPVGKHIALAHRTAAQPRARNLADGAHSGTGFKRVSSHFYRQWNMGLFTFACAIYSHGF